MGLLRGNSTIKYAVDHGFVRVDLDTGLVYGKRNRAIGTLDGKGYLRAQVAAPNGSAFPVSLHRLIAYVVYGDRVFDAGVVVHHINGNKLDNRASNLKLVSEIEHMRLTFPNTTSPIKDWYAIKVGDEVVGCVDNEEDARLIALRRNGVIVKGRNPRKLIYQAYDRAVKNHRRKGALNP